MNDVPVVCYLRATPDGNPEWSEDCVCEDPVYPSHDEERASGRMHLFQLGMDCDRREWEKLRERWRVTA